MNPAELVASWNEREHRDAVPEEQRSFRCEAAGERRPVLLIHGAGGGPADLQELAEHLRARGHSSLCPLLPSHGRGDSALADLRFDALLERCFTAAEALQSDSEPPAIVGQSLGGVLAVHVAARGLVWRFAALAPAFRPFVARRVLELVAGAVLSPRRAREAYRWQMELRGGIEETRTVIPEVKCPLLVLHSRDDDSVSPRGSQELVRNAGSVEKRLELLDGQGHVLSQAPDRLERVFEPVRAFLESPSAPAVGSRTTSRQPGAA